MNNNTITTYIRNNYKRRKERNRLLLYKITEYMYNKTQTTDIIRHARSNVYK